MFSTTVHLFVVLATFRERAGGRGVGGLACCFLVKTPTGKMKLLLIRIKVTKHKFQTLICFYALL